MVMKPQSAFLSSPIGTIKITATDRGIEAITFTDDDMPKVQETSFILAQCMEELTEYFAGSRKHFSTTLVMRATDFQQRVWDALLGIPFGSTVTYRALAEEIGVPDGARAVGTAVGSNPLMIVVPCHRVVPATGGVGEYAFGTEKKEWLLKHESKY